MTATILFLLATVSAAGACVGSFIGTWSLRRARGEQALVGRSRCDDCHRRLSWAEMAPVASYLVLGGRCRSCRAPLDRLQLASEVGGALVPPIVALACLAMARPPASFGFGSALGLILLAIAINVRRSRASHAPTPSNPAASRPPTAAPPALAGGQGRAT